MFGEVVNGAMRLSPVGTIAQDYWEAIPDHMPHIVLDAFIVMPDHVHGLIGIIDDDSNIRRDVACNVSTTDARIQTTDARIQPSRMSEISPKRGELGTIIRSYKSAVSRWCSTHDHRSFAWQSRFYDRIIHDNATVMKARQYIMNNPLKWDIEQHRPENLYR